MSTIKDIARIEGNGGDGVPAIDPEGIVNTARLVWFTVSNRIAMEGSSNRSSARDGHPGRIWDGSLNALISSLWPELSDSHKVDSETANDIKYAINRYLRSSHNMFCLRRGGRGYPSTWWVAQHWSELTVRKVVEEPEAVVEEVAVVPENIPTTDVFDLSTPAPDQSGEFECRVGCGMSSHLLRLRNRHEFHKHGTVFRKDGTVETFDPNTKPTDEEIKQFVLDQLNEPGSQQTHWGLFGGIRQFEPRITKLDLSRILDRMIADDLLRYGSRSSEYYLFYTIGNEETRMDIDRTESEPSAPSGLAEHIANMEALLLDLRVMGSEHDELASLRDALTSVTAERDSLADQLSSVNEQLAQVTRDRDSANALLATLRRNLMGRKDKE